MSESWCRIYAIRRTLGSRETGVWIGFPWSAIEDNIASQPPTVEQFTGKLGDAKAAIIFMLKKKGFNFPLHAQDKPLPVPRSFLPRSAPAPLAPAPLRASTPAAPSPTKPKAPAALLAQGGEKRRPVDRVNHARGASESASSDDSFASAEGDGDDLHNAAASLAISERRDLGREREDALAIEILSRFITPPASMSADGDILRFPISFGALADEFLMKRAASEGELWSLLRVRPGSGSCLSSHSHAWFPSPSTMPAYSNIDQLLKKLARPAQKVGNKRVKEPWRHRKSNRAGIKLTEAERQERKDRREKKRDALEDALTSARETMYKYAEAMSEEFGRDHNADYYYRLIMQRSTMKIKPRRISGWNAFVHKEMKELNEGQLHGNREQLHKGGHMQELSERWKAMSEEQRAAAIGDGVEELSERRENRKEGVQNVHINAFHDTRATLAKVQQELEFLAGRTGMCVLTLAVRSSLDSFNPPFIFVSEPRISQHMETITGKTVLDLAIGLEALCVSGITGLTQTHRNQLNDLKKKTSNLILEKLRAAVGSRGDIAKMYYVNFEHHVTFKFGVILECWPLQKFASPSTFSSLPIVNILYSAFESGATRFRTLSDDEWQQWREAFQAGGSAPAVTPSQAPMLVQAGDITSADDSENPDHPLTTNPDTAPSTLDASTAAPPATSGAPPATLSAAPAPITAPASNSGTAPPTNSGAAPTSLASGGPLAAQFLPGQSASSPATDNPAAGQKRTIDQVDGATDLFINNFGGADGLVQVTKRARKKRSDAGVKRGPRKKPATTNVAPSPA
ncbi:hypothetical protein GSI_08309 [Ganoderma sinense ZZ0214-1]|uniref:Uncharacterized protein n=1 Tax=Ganoderma sinense ZZ0214-1 TaxID=1077348 RepID=A0A2G8S6W8_9APHY|nr:hypothetical protein GSI_08309 [Ganoderma sinense ZZ0214-1]